jgi:hypothetical protein
MPGIGHVRIDFLYSDSHLSAERWNGLLDTGEQCRLLLLAKEQTSLHVQVDLMAVQQAP